MAEKDSLLLQPLALSDANAAKVLGFSPSLLRWMEKRNLVGPEPIRVGLKKTKRIWLYQDLKKWADRRFCNRAEWLEDEAKMALGSLPPKN